MNNVVEAHKSGFVQVRGDAFYDWQADRLSWPIGGALQFTITEEMVAGWEELKLLAETDSDLVGSVLISGVVSLNGFTYKRLRSHRRG